jgi:hypothetical protein
MTASTPAAGRIFISYRRQETAYPAGWLYDRLVEHLGQGQVFKDVDSIELGDDFVEVITAAVAGCDVLLALIGDRWLTITGEDGQRRLDDPGDFVRLEIEAALTRNVRVIPVLVDGARMPRVAEVPASLAKLVRRQALELSPSRFDFDTRRLLRVLDSSLADAQARQAGTGPEVPVPPAPTGHDTDTQPSSVSIQASGQAAAASAPAAKAPGPDTAGIQEEHEAADSHVRRMLFLSSGLIDAVLPRPHRTWSRARNGSDHYGGAHHSDQSDNRPDRVFDWRRSRSHGGREQRGIQPGRHDPRQRQ